jgi:hypothetical protein
MVRGAAARVADVSRGSSEDAPEEHGPRDRDAFGEICRERFSATYSALITTVVA